LFTSFGGVFDVSRFIQTDSAILCNIDMINASDHTLSRLVNRYKLSYNEIHYMLIAKLRNNIGLSGVYRLSYTGLELILHQHDQTGVK
jgi:hypothetical protein